MTYASTVLADSPAGYWRLDEASGASSFADSSGNSRTATGASSGTAIAGAVDGDGAQTLIGSTGASVAAGGGTPFYGTGPITLEAIVRLTQTSASYGQIAGIRDDSTADFYLLQLASSANIEARFRNSGGTDFTLSTSLTTNVWHHLALVYDGSHLTLYRDGTQVAQVTASGSLGTGQAFSIGRTAAGDFAYRGDVDEVALYSSGLSSARVTAHYSATGWAPISTSGTWVRGSRGFTSTAATGITRSTSLSVGRGGRTFAVAAAPLTVTRLTAGRGSRGFGLTAAGLVTTGGGRPDAATATGWARADRGFLTVADSDDIPVTPPPGYVLYRRTSLSVPAPTFDDDGWSNPLQPPTTIFDGPWRRLRLKFAGVDRTFFRGVEIRVIRYRHSTPFGAEHCVVELPQATPFERPGVGALDWLAEGKGLRMDLIKPDGTVDPTWTWIGQCQSANPVWNENGFSIQAEYLGFAYQPGDYVQKPLPTPRDSGAVDIGKRVADTLNVTGRHYPAVAPATTGITTRKRGSLTQSPLDFARELLAEAWTADGRQWTVVSSPGTRTQALQIVLPDTTVDYTISLGQPGVSFDGLSEDNDENPNCVYGQWIDPNGGLHQRLKWPRLHEDTAPAYPLSIGSVFNPGSGTTGFQPFSDWMRRNGFAGFDSQNTYLASDSDDVEDAQQRMGITVDGVVGAQTWGTAFNTGADVGDLNSAIYMPLAVDPRVEPWLYAPDGKRLSANPAYNSYIRRKEVFVNLGEGLTYRDARRTAQQILARAGGISLVGQIVCEGADPEETSWLNAVSGTTLRVRYLWGSGSTGVKFMISSILIEPQDDGHYRVTLDVDTKRRDAFTVAQIIERNRVARIDPARQIRQRSSTQTQDTKIQFDADEIGRIYRHALQGGFWRVVEFPAASWGTFVRVVATTSPSVEFALGLFDTEITPRDLDRLVGNPLAAGNTRPWTPDAPALAAAGLIQAWGSAAQPGGYSKTGAADGYKSDGDTLTGRLEYDSNVDFAPANGASLFLAEWVPSSTTMSVRFYLAPVEF